MDYIGEKVKQTGDEEAWEALIGIIREKLSPARWQHTVGVVKAADRLACIFGADRQKAVQAAYCHDFTKEWTLQQNAEYIKKYDLPSRCIAYPEIAHGYVAAAVLKEEYGIQDEEILDAIRYHSTGKENMTLIEKIIYLADLTEEGRQYKGVEKIRAATGEDLDDALALALGEVIAFVRRQGKEPDESSVKALAYLMERRVGEKGEADG